MYTLLPTSFLTDDLLKAHVGSVLEVHVIRSKLLSQCQFEIDQCLAKITLAADFVYLLIKFLRRAKFVYLVFDLVCIYCCL